MGVFVLWCSRIGTEPSAAEELRAPARETRFVQTHAIRIPHAYTHTHTPEYYANTCACTNTFKHTHTLTHMPAANIVYTSTSTSRKFVHSVLSSRMNPCSECTCFAYTNTTSAHARANGERAHACRHSFSMCVCSLLCRLSRRRQTQH